MMKKYSSSFITVLIICSVLTSASSDSDPCSRENSGCSKRTEPVCGADGTTYDNYCFAECRQVEYKDYACPENPLATHETDFKCKRTLAMFTDDDFYTTVDVCSAGSVTETIQEYSTGVSTYSRGTGTCEGAYEKQVFRTGSNGQNCPLLGNFVIERPARIIASARASCLYYYTETDQSVEHAGFTLWNEVYGVRLYPKTNEIKVIDFETGEWVVNAFGKNMDGYIVSDNTGEDNWHEFVFDMRKDSTFFYYNDVLIFEHDASLAEEGQFVMEGTNSIDWMVDLRIEDESCSMPCSAEKDCSGRGTTNDQNNKDGCDCQCPYNWRGDSCEIEVFEKMLTGYGCREEMVDTSRNPNYSFLNIESAIDCFEWCEDMFRDVGNFQDCNFVSYDPTVNECYIYFVCNPQVIPLQSTDIATQNHEMYIWTEQCHIDPDVLGSMFAKLLPSCSYANDNLEVFYQIPAGYKLEELSFDGPTKTGQDADLLTQSEEFWTKKEYSCLDFYSGIFPMKQLYDPVNGINNLAFQVQSNMMKTRIYARYTQRLPFLDTFYTRVIEFKMPLTLILATKIDLQIDMNVSGPCVGINCGECKTCVVIGVEATQKAECVPDNSLENEECDDGDSNTWPDTCLGGACVGPPLCTYGTCDFCEQCVVVENYLDSGNPHPICESNLAFEGRSCEDLDDLTENDRCQSGICRGDPSDECTCNFQ